ncbi:DUF58 domain-containing protein [Thiosulfativibrio zosterae]|uniref:DUF58 domain-containing protein n=1 Tax=Thiosulfativibrio zosterae TaxID=2675053 RepID=A0A6F8PJW3_9GAMM|nr:DUF58 domain-containing protein [Thiosulfativibrio zosterae]BBP42347.1 hypothetical protein THMIRHAT_00930 [Thiosulfativibrio zosterae]
MISAYSNLEDLLAIRFHVKHRKLAHQQNLQKSGGHRALRKGRGMEFQEVRQYQAGDDVRHIDWRVSARTTETHSKVFSEELDKPVLFVVEQTPCCFFGSKHRFKTDQILHILAALGWATLNQGDQVGGLVFNHQNSIWIDPKHQQQTLMQLFHAGLQCQQALKKPNVSDAGDWLKALKKLQKMTRPGQKLMLLGDFMGFPAEGFGVLQTLKRHCDINAIHVFDPLEKDLPNLGQVRLSDGINEQQLNAADRQLRDGYASLYQTEWQALQQQMARLKVPLLSVSTADLAAESLFKQGVLR